METRSYPLPWLSCDPPAGSQLCSQDVRGYFGCSCVSDFPAQTSVTGTSKPTEHWERSPEKGSLSPGQALSTPLFMSSQLWILEIVHAQERWSI